MRSSMRVKSAFVMLGCRLHGIADWAAEVGVRNILVLIGVAMLMVVAEDVDGVKSRICMRVRDRGRGRAVNGERDCHQNREASAQRGHGSALHRIR